MTNKSNSHLARYAVVSLIAKPYQFAWFVNRDDYAAQYLEINAELGWDKYRLITSDPTPWVDDNLGGRWSTQKMEAYKALGSSFNFTYEPREEF